MTSIHPASSVVNSENVPFNGITSMAQANESKQSTNNHNFKVPTGSARVNSSYGKDIYFSRLITFKSIFGVTFFGNQYHDYPNARLRPFLIGLLVFYDLLCIAAMLYLEFHAFNQYIYTRLFRNSSDKLTMNIIFRSSGYCILIEYLVIKLLTLTRGPQLIKSIIEIGRGVRLDDDCLVRYYMIYGVILLEIVIHSASFVLMFQPMIKLDASPLSRWLMLIFYATVGILYSATKCCVCSLHMYASILICKRISENKANLQSCPNFGVMLEDMLQLKNQLGNFNSQLSETLLVKVVVNSILLCTIVCAIDDKLRDATHLEWDGLVALSLLFVSQLMDEIISCIASQKIANAIESFIRAIQELTAQQCSEYLHMSANPPALLKENGILSQCRNVDETEYRCLQHICSMKDSFLYNVLNLFDLRSVTILVIVSNVTNYSVLLIQTTDLNT